MSRVHPTAVVDKDARIAADVEVGPYCVIGPHVTIGHGTHLMSHVVVDGRTTVGERCRIFPFACIGTQTQDLKYDGGRTFVEIGDDTTIREYATVNSGTAEGETTRVGSRCLLMAYTHVAHASVVGDEVIMSNCATLAGEVEVEPQAIISGLVAVHQFVRIGRMAMVGGLTPLTQDVPPYMLVSGNPPSVHGPNTVGLRRRGMPPEERGAVKDAFRILYREGLSTRQALERISSELPDLPPVRALADFVRASKRGIIK